MTEMKRLLDEPLSANAERVLRSAETDEPSPPELAKGRTLATIAALPATAFVPLPSREGRGLVRAGTWGALALVVVIGGVVAIRSSATSPAEMPGRGPGTPAMTASVTPPASPTGEGIRVEDLPSAVPSGGVVPVRRASPAPSSSSLEDELAAIDAARASLAAGHPDAALMRAQAYQRRFRDGRFSEEADALEIQALAEMGRRAEAQEKGARFLAARPGSPYERRVRSAIGLEEVKP